MHFAYCVNEETYYRLFSILILQRNIHSRDSFAKLPNRIPPTVESKIGQLPNQNLIEILDIQVKN